MKNNFPNNTTVLGNPLSPQLPSTSEHQQFSNQTIIELLEKQNQTLEKVYLLLHKHEQQSLVWGIIKFSLALMPYLALIVVIWYLFRTLQNYLDILNNNVTALHDSFIHLEESVGKLIPDFSQIKSTLGNTWQSAKDLIK